MIGINDLLRYADSSLSFEKELHHWREKFAGVHPEPILIRVTPEPDILRYIVLCRCSGIPFLPIHPALPEAEIRSLAARIGANIIISNDDLPSCAQKIFVSPPDCSIPPVFPSSRESRPGIHPVLWLSTSGSTGAPKLVPITETMIAAAAQSAPILQPSPGKSWLLNLPLNHAGGMGIVLRSLAWNTPVRFANAHKAETIAHVLSQYDDIGVISLVPTQFSRLRHILPVKRLQSLENILIGGGSLNMSDLEFANNNQLPLRQSYGMTETLGHFCLTEKAADHPLQPFECGRPLPQNDIRTERETEESENGNVLLRGNQVFSGYHDEDAHFSGDWFHTGDFGYFNSDGNFVFEARRTDIIKSGGENVNINRVEQAILSIGWVSETAVIPVSDPEWGQRVHAFILTSDDKELTDTALIEYLRSRLSAWEIPKSFSFVSQLPRTYSGKIDKKRIGEMYS